VRDVIVDRLARFAGESSFAEVVIGDEIRKDRIGEKAPEWK